MAQSTVCCCLQCTGAAAAAITKVTQANAKYHWQALTTPHATKIAVETEVDITPMVVHAVAGDGKVPPNFDAALPSSRQSRPA